MKDRALGKMLFQIPIEHELYAVCSAFPSIASDKHVETSLLSHCVSSEILHCRLGHTSSALQQTTLCTISSSIKQVKKVCSSCRFGKCSKLLFNLSSSISHFPLDLIHCDVWGPSLVRSISGYRYYVIFVDDFTRYC